MSKSSKTKEIYPWYWPLISWIIKNRAGWRCEHCGHTHDPGLGYTLTVHHIDCNPLNCDHTNLVALCQRCHLHFQSYSLPYQEWLDFYKPQWLIERGH